MAKEERNQQPVLEVNNLKTYFDSENGPVKAVDGVSFQVNRGETVGIVGESGSGKSVSSLSLMRLIPNPPGRIVEGEMLFNSEQFGRVDLSKISRAEMKKIRGNEMSMIFQEPMTSLNPVYTCGNQVMEVLYRHYGTSHNEAKARTIEAFKQVGLPRPDDIFRAYPHEISGGQKQRVMIAMAMACNPGVLIADEPTTALDVTVQAKILDLMRDLRDRHGTSILFITHDLGVIAELADRVIVMYRGKIVEQGTVWDIFSNPQHPYTKGLLACRPRLDLQLRVLPTVADFMDTSADGQLSEKKQETGKYNSVGEAIFFNVVSDEDTQEQREKIYSQAPVLEVKNLKTYYPIAGKTRMFSRAKEWVKAVDDVTLEVYPGETLGLVGESGCGKTTLGRTIMRLVDSTSGQVLFHGKDITHLKGSALRHLRKEMQIIFQDPYSSLNPRITVGQTILEPMRVHKVLSNNKQRKAKVIELLETVGLSGDHYNRYPHEFSGGQRQRIAIARALALEPNFLILDESVSALDVSVQAQVLNLLNRLKEEFNFTYIFISHDLSVVKFIADRVVVMNSGKIIEQGYPEELYENPNDPYTRQLINAIPKGDLEDIRKAQVKRKMARQNAESA